MLNQTLGLCTKRELAAKKHTWATIRPKRGGRSNLMTKTRSSRE